jgi:uncharacterized membrane protein YgcG
VTGMLLVLLNTRAISRPKARTVHGDRAVAAVRAKGSDADPIERVAVSGPRAHPDGGVSYALTLAAPAALVPATWGYASAGSFNTYVPTSGGSGSSGGGYTCSSSSSSSSCSGGGSSCGGGGGCGGGSSS